MPDLSIFKIDSQTINIKDTTARQTADSAKTLATTASGNATTALNKINEQDNLIRYGFPFATSVEICDIRAGGWMAGFIACNIAEGGVSTGYYKIEGNATATITWLNAGAITPTITVSNSKIVLSASKDIVSYIMLIA